jgi:hypothetical protein
MTPALDIYLQTLCPPSPLRGVWPADGRANTSSRVPSGGGCHQLSNETAPLTYYYRVDPL